MTNPCVSQKLRQCQVSRENTMRAHIGTWARAERMDVDLAIVFKSHLRFLLRNRGGLRPVQIVFCRKQSFSGSGQSVCNVFIVLEEKCPNHFAEDMNRHVCRKFVRH